MTWHNSSQEPTQSIPSAPTSKRRQLVLNIGANKGLYYMLDLSLTLLLKVTQSLYLLQFEMASVELGKWKGFADGHDIDNSEHYDGKNTEKSENTKNRPLLDFFFFFAFFYL